jgi:D-glycero-alpha-D-manno-heptose-7-phosphate kinase
MIIVRAPFRLPIGGGGTDLPSYYKNHEGFLITAAINKYMYININEPAIINKIKLNYSKVEMVEIDNVNEIKHDIVREALKYLKISRPMEISSMADLSAGTGMGSSSSYTVALLKGLNTMMRRHITTKELAEEACKIEIDQVGKPIGKQDQYAAAYGGIIQLDIDRLGNTTVTPIQIEEEVIYELEHRLLMFYTKIERDANIILGEQSTKAKNNDTVAIESMHAIKEIGFKIKRALLEGDVDKLGNLFNEHWLEKKRISNKMSNPEIDNWYEHALKNGALGGKIMGAGGGGFMIFCCKEGQRKNLRSAMESIGLSYMDFNFDYEGAKVLADIK